MKNIIIAGAVIILILVGAWIVLSNQEAKNAVVINDEETPLAQPDMLATESDAKTGKGSLRSLLSLGQSQECSFVVRADGMLQEGTAFYDGGNARIDTMVTGGGEAPIASYMIMDQKSNTMYMWGSAQGDKGIRMTMTESADSNATDGADSMSYGDMPTGEAGVTPDTDVDYTCKPWRVDGSVFVPPRDVEFMDMSDMQKMMEGMGGLVPTP